MKVVRKFVRGPYDGHYREVTPGIFGVVEDNPLGRNVYVLNDEDMLWVEHLADAKTPKLKKYFTKKFLKGK